MSFPAVKKTTTAEERIGDIAAMQPLSGVARVDETGAVSGLGHGAFVRQEEAEKKEKH